MVAKKFIIGKLDGKDLSYIMLCKDDKSLVFESISVVKNGYYNIADKKYLVGDYIAVKVGTPIESTFDCKCPNCSSNKFTSELLGIERNIITVDKKEPICRLDTSSEETGTTNCIVCGFKVVVNSRTSYVLPDLLCRFIEDSGRTDLLAGYLDTPKYPVNRSYLKKFKDFFKW